ncbi:MAG: PhzF family phenazine biosynthesis protein [Chloroflexi bacterium]|nr:PhzF family phenazine biosynthesis protein [Chloroflexota bacterium]
MQLDYHLLDVFTNQPFGGNQLAVFPGPPADLPASIMQKIAKELNLSETTFVLPPADADKDFRLRIFTPAAELPMAGHPTVGSAWLLAKLGLASGERIVFEEGVGPIGVTIVRDEAGQPRETWMQQPIPKFGDIVDDRALVAKMLSLDEVSLSTRAPIQAVSSGLPFLFVPLTGLDAMSRISLRLEIWRERFAESSAPQIFATTTETSQPESAAHSRMFAPGLGIAEDAATGSASGPLGAYLLRYGLAETENMLVEQGFEMGRPSLIKVRVGRRRGKITQVAVGGESVYLGAGKLLLD